MLLSILEWAAEFVTRPNMDGVALDIDLQNSNAVVTGGCGAVGLEMAIMLAKAGANVVIGCHGSDSKQVDAVEGRLAELGLLNANQASDDDDDDGLGGSGGIEVWPLQLESFERVREFAARVANEVGMLDLLVHNAATKTGCTRTVDGHEYITQVNYLSPFLLTQLLLPTMRSGS